MAIQIATVGYGGRSVQRQPCLRVPAAAPVSGAGVSLVVVDTYGIPNGFEVYSGTHTSAVTDRFQNHVMLFFGAHLCATRCE